MHTLRLNEKCGRPRAKVNEFGASHGLKTLDK